MFKATLLAATCAATQLFEDDDAFDSLSVIDPGNLTTVEYNTVIAGIMFGIIDQNDCTEIEACGTDSAHDVIQAYNALQLIITRKPLKVAAGVAMLRSVVEDIPTDLNECKNIQDDIASLQAWSTVFLDPAHLQEVVEHDVKRHILSLTTHARKAQQDWNNENYFGFGTELGEMLVIATQ